MSVHYAALDNGVGVCVNFDESSNSCMIYGERPLLCNVEEAYGVYFKDYMSREDYYAENVKVCEYLRAL